MNISTITELETPAALVDLKRLQANTTHMSKRAHRLGVHLRPHVKTHKCIEAARYQVDGHFGGITVSTLAEADTFSSAGFTDITYAVPLAPSRAGRAVNLAAKIPRFQVLVDHPSAVGALGLAMQKAPKCINVLIKVDCGYGRAGLLPHDPELVNLASLVVQTPGLSFAGVLAHAGHAYDCMGACAIKKVAEMERRETVKAAESIRAAGIPVSVVSVGSTPTAAHVENLDGITELRPGNYALFDRFQAQIGACDADQIALSVLSEVIGVYPQRATILIDAGALALSKDLGATHVSNNNGFGIVCDDNLHLLKGLSLVSLSQEHGKILIAPDFDGMLPSVGNRLRILPNHSCLVTALHQQLYVIDHQRVVGQWRPVRGW